MTATAILPVALQGPDLFLSGGETVDVYQLAGSYDVKPGPPSVFESRLTGLRVGRPRLRFMIATKPGHPTVQTFTVRLPRGLAFTSNSGKLESGVSIASARPALSEHKGTLSAESLPSLGRLTVTVEPRALSETDRLEALIRHRSNHHKRRLLDIEVKTTTTTGDRSTVILKVRTG
jgi:hypothetical protein